MANDSSSRADEAKRPRFSFWLNRDKEDDCSLIKLIAYLKAERLFTQTIRDGLRLINDLRAGNLNVLFELFPWVRAEFMEYLSEIQLNESQDTSQQHQSSMEDSNSDDIAAIKKSLIDEQQRIEQLRAEQAAYEHDLEQWAQEREKQIAAQWEHIEREKERLAAERERNQSAIEKKLEKLEQLLIQQGNRPIERPSAGRGGGPRPLGGGGPQQLGANNLPPPTFDDEEDAALLEVKESEGGESNASMNFIRSVQRLMEL